MWNMIPMHLRVKIWAQKVHMEYWQEGQCQCFNCGQVHFEEPGRYDADLQQEGDVVRCCWCLAVFCNPACQIPCDEDCIQWCINCKDWYCKRCTESWVGKPSCVVGRELDGPPCPVRIIDPNPAADEMEVIDLTQEAEIEVINLVSESDSEDERYSPDSPGIDSDEGESDSDGSLYEPGANTE